MFALLCFGIGTVAGLLLPRFFAVTPAIPPNTTTSAQRSENLRARAQPENASAFSSQDRVATDPRSRPAYLLALARIDRMAAIRELEGIGSEEAIRGRNEILLGWLVEDPDAACAYIFSNARELIQTAAFTNSIIAAKRYDLVFDAVTHLDIRDQRAYVGEVGTRWPLEDQKHFTDFLGSLSDPDSRGVALEQALASWSKDDFDGATRFAAQTAYSPADRSRANCGLASGLIGSGRIQTALQWLSAQPESHELDEARNVIASTVAGYDLDRALLLLSKNQESLTTSIAINRTLRQAEEQVPGSTMIALLQLPNFATPAYREERVIRSFQHWYSTEPVEATAYLNTCGMPPELHDRILSSVQGGRR